NRAYNDEQGTLADEMAWIDTFVNLTYLWYDDVPVVDAAAYSPGTPVRYVTPSTNAATTATPASNYGVVDAYFNSQRSPLTTASGKPKDQFHFTYVTTDWIALNSSGNVGGFGFHAAVLAPTAPRLVVDAYTEPGSPADAAGIARGTRFLSVNGVDVTS